MIQNLLKKLGLTNRQYSGDHVAFSELKGINHHDQTRRILSGAGIWNEVVTLVRLNDTTYSQVFFTKEYEPSVEQLLSDEFLIFHQATHQGNIIKNLGCQPLPKLLSKEQYMCISQAEFNEDLGVYSLDLPADARPAYLLLEIYGTNCVENLVLRSNEQPYTTLDEWMSFLTEGGKLHEGINERDLALKLQKNFRKISCHGVRLFHQVNDPLATDLLAYANFFCESSCGVLARIFALCCTAAGLKARVWRLARHTLTEVFIGGRYRIIDGDPYAARYYPNPDDPEDLMGLEDIWRYGKGLFTNNLVPVIPDYMAELEQDEFSLEDKKRKRIADLTDKSKATLLETPESLGEKFCASKAVKLTMTLLPGELLLWCYADRAPWNASTARSFRDPTNTRVLVKEADLCGTEFINCMDSRDIQVSRYKDNRLLAVSDSATLKLKLDSTYPILDLVVDITVQADLFNAVECALYSNGHAVAEIRPVNQYIKNKIRFRLRRALIRLHRNEDLEIVLKIKKGVIANEMRVAHICQASHLAMPRFISGTNYISLNGANLTASSKISLFSSLDKYVMQDMN